MNAADQAIAADMTKLQADVTDCGIKNLGADPATTNCIVTGTGLSEPCAKCFATMVACAIEKCLAKCAADMNSQDCADCREQNCNAALESCSGINIP